MAGHALQSTRLEQFDGKSEVFQVWTIKKSSRIRITFEMQNSIPCFNTAIVFVLDGGGAIVLARG